MTDVFEVAGLLVEDAVRSHGDDVDLVAYYGSWAQGTARTDSDLDIFYTPRDGADPPLARAFLLEGRLFDFWAISWETLEGFATGRRRGFSFAPAVVHHAKVLYARNDEVSARLAGLKDLLEAQRGADARPEMVRRAVGALAGVRAALGGLHLAVLDGNLSGARRSGWTLVRAAIECLALANQTFFDRGIGAALHELDRLLERPSDLAGLVRAVATSMEPDRLLRAGAELAAATRDVILRIDRSLPGERSADEVFRGAYPELGDRMRQVRSAGADADVFRAGAAAWHLAAHLDDLSASVRDPEDAPLQVPDLLAVSPEDPEELILRTRRLDARLRSFLAARRIGLEEYDSLDDLRRSLRS